MKKPINSKIENILNKLLLLIDEYPTLIHIWRFAIGAAYGLDEALELDHIERSTHTLDDFPKHVLDAKLVISQLLNRSITEKAWRSGFYFHSALMRIDAFSERILKTLLLAPNKNQSDVGRLLYQLNEIHHFYSETEFSVSKNKISKVRTSVKKLKHFSSGENPCGAITIPQAIESLEEILKIIICPTIRTFMDERFKNGCETP